MTDRAASPLVICGVGPIGARVAELANSGPGVAALADRDPDGVRGRLPDALRNRSIHLSLAGALEACPRTPVVLCTTSSFQDQADDLRVAIAAGSPVVTSCEEAAWPFARHPALCREIHDLAQRAGVPIVGAGINPGFLMDFLPAIAAAPFPEPEQIVVTRRVDVATRRAPLQEKVGLGLTVEEFEERRRGAGIGHRGLEESVHLLGEALGVAWDRVECALGPVVSDTDQQTDSDLIPAGRVVGMSNTASAYLGGECRVVLDLIMAYALHDPVDRIELRGPPPLPAVLECAGGVPGDEGTARILLAAAAAIAHVPAGLRTILDLPGGLRAHWRSP